MPLSLSGRYALAWALIGVACLSMTACGAGTAKEGGAPKDRTSTEGSTEGTTEETAAVTIARCLEGEPSDALVRDARRWARDKDIPVKEAIREARLDECYWHDAAGLERELRHREAQTFAGFWVEYEPEYRYIFLFTREGEETIRPYIEGETYARFIEARSWADATLKELEAARDRASRLVDESDIRAEGISTNVKKNRVEIFATDKTRFRAALRKKDARLPEHVVVVEIDGPMGPA